MMMGSALFDGMRQSLRLDMAVAIAVGVWLSLGSSSALAAGEAHPFLNLSFGRTSTEAFSDPNGIAIDESTGDVYVAAIGTNTVYKFDANGNPVDFAALTSNQLNGNTTPSSRFSFPNVYGTPAAVAVDNSTNPADPSAGDLYVMDAGNGVIDKFGPSGEYLSQITGFSPATGSVGNELLGLAVEANGTVRVELSYTGFAAEEHIAVDEFDDSSANRLIAQQLNRHDGADKAGLPMAERVHGFAVGPTGDDYLLYGERFGRACSCTVKVGQQLAGLGVLDSAGSGDVAIAADSASGHVYVSDQSSVTEWDTSAMNGSPAIRGTETNEAAGTLVSRFGSLQLTGSSMQGGIAVDGSSGKIYVSNPGDGKVYVFGSDVPAVTAGAPTSVTKEAATLIGTVDPRGAAIASCAFEYGIADEYGRSAYEHSVPCQPAAAAISVGGGPIPVSAQIEGLKPGLLYRFRVKAGNVDGSSESAGLLATLGEAFAVKKFEVSFINEDGSPDTQAGSHPHEMVVTIEFTSHFQRTESNADSLFAREPTGTLKDLAVDLPPGLVGDPNATPKKCTLDELRVQGEGVGQSTAFPDPPCPSEALLGYLHVEYSEFIRLGGYKLNPPVFNIVAAPGVALQLGVWYAGPKVIINNGLLAGGDYPVQSTIVNAPPEAPVYASRLRISGVVGEGPSRKAFLTLPTGCRGPLRSKMRVSSYEEPNHFAEATSLTRNTAGTPVSLTGCSKLQFPPTISVTPDTTNASTSSGLTVKVNVPQTAAFNPDGLAESSLRDTTVILPEGVALNPAGADGLEACSSDPSAVAAGALGTPGDQIGYLGSEEFNPEFEPGVMTKTFTPEIPNPLRPGANFCPNGSKIGTVKIKTPLLEHELEGAVYLAAQNANPFGSLVAMYMVAEDEHSGSLIKLTGEVSLTPAGQIVTTFKNTPDLPFENLDLHFFGGERAPLTTPTRCGMYTTQAVFTPWDGNGAVNAASSFIIEHGPSGTPCPGASLPFNPSLAAGTTSIQAGGFSPFTMTMSRDDGQQSLQSVSLKMPPGLSGLLTGLELCPEPQADQGTCGPNSLIGETIVSVGVGNDPFSVKGGKVYLTGPYRGAPFGLSIVNPAKAGPYDVEHDTSKPGEYMPACDCLVVRAKIEVDPITADLTVTSDNEGPYKIPTILDGIPLQIKHVNVTINRPSFTFNPTDCSPMSITGSLYSTEGATDALSVPFQATNCARLSFKPQFNVSTSGKTSRAKGASLHVKLVYPKLPFGSQANIASVKVDLPKQLPSRLTTLQKACVDRVFHENPASCPAASRVGMAKAITPLVPVPLEGPAYFVSHGGAKFPELIVVLQGYGVTIDLHGETFINKAGITSSTFRTIPDAPVGSFELTLPQGPDSALAANGNLCRSSLKMPTAFTAQNGAVIRQSTPISVTACAKHKRKAKTSRHKHRHYNKKGKKK
jgi:DNA-binding beta-propeller fold protein YncE